MSWANSEEIIFSVISDLCTVFVHVARTPCTPPIVCPGLTGGLLVLTTRPALVTGHGAVDRHPGAVPLALALSIAGPVLAPLVAVLAARLRCGGRLCGGGSHSSPYLFIRRTRTLVESVDLPHIRVRELILSYLTLSLLLYDCDQAPGLNRTRPWKNFLES